MISKKESGIKLIDGKKIFDMFMLSYVNSQTNCDVYFSGILLGTQVYNKILFYSNILKKMNEAYFIYETVLYF